MVNPIKIPVILQNIGKAQGLAAGAATSVAGAAGSAGSRVQGAMFGAGGPGEITKGLGQIAKQLPGAGMMEGMTSAFKQGGPIGVMTAGVAGMLGFVKPPDVVNHIVNPDGPPTKVLVIWAPGGEAARIGSRWQRAP